MQVKLEKDPALVTSATLRITVRWGLLYVFWHHWHPCTVWVPREVYES